MFKIDYHEIIWIVKAFGYNNLDDICKNKPKRIESLSKARESYDFLLRIRSQLHIQSKTKNDVLSFSSQIEAANYLNYEDWYRGVYVHRLNHLTFACFQLALEFYNNNIGSVDISEAFLIDTL